MTDNIRVTCLIDRYWDALKKEYAGTTFTGVLIDISAGAANTAGELSPAGIVLLDNGTFECVPLQFIKKESNA